MTEVRVNVGAHAPAGIIRDIKAIADRYPGESPLYLQVETGDGYKTYRLGIGVDYEADFFLAIRDLGVGLEIR